MLIHSHKASVNIETDILITAIVFLQRNFDFGGGICGKVGWMALYPFKTAKGTILATALAQPHPTTIRTTSSISL